MKKLLLLLTLSIITISISGCATGSTQPTIPEAENVKVFKTDDGYWWNTQTKSELKDPQKRLILWNEMWIAAVKIADKNGYKYFGFINDSSVDFRNGFPINTYTNLTGYMNSRRDGKQNPFEPGQFYTMKIMYFTEKPSGVFVFDVEKVKEELKVGKPGKFFFFAE